MNFLDSLAIPPVDAAIIALYILGTTLLGVWLGRGENSTDDFFLGSGNLPSWALLLSIVATETSTVTFLSIPGIAFEPGGNFGFLQLAMGYIIGRVCVLTFLLPLYFKGKNATAYEVFQRNFGTSTRKLASVLFLGARTLGDGLRLFLTAFTLQQVIHINFDLSVALIAIATAIYALFGGVRSVVWNDCLQFAVYMTGAVIAIGVILYRLPGGAEEYFNFASETGRLRLFNTSFLPADGQMTLWSGIFGGAVLSLATHGADQLIVQRYLCAKDQRSAGLALFWSGPIVFAQFALFLAIGAGLACYYAQFDPARESLAGDQAFASFIVNDLPVGIRGIILAAVFAAAMSTLSSSVNSSSSSLMDDLGGEPLRQLPEKRRLLLARVFTVLFTVFQAVVAIVVYYQGFASTVVDQALAIAGFSAGLLLGLFLITLIIGRVPSLYANIGLLSGAVIVVCVYRNYGLSGYWNSLICCVSVFTITAAIWSVMNYLFDPAPIASVEDET
ncbi:sodium:solute symporter family transporter [Blastopirellula marina]|uniref:Transporter n=1 Tax=Blastopirellula marina TaxID=124 RepID=A0A2S8GC78_9BACT|nr:transporter [Blastopirellula marina]PQO41871.1 transporter [Blastopirellula marina]PTL46229.1 transporter [Blastopirellula marina]